MEPKTKKKVGWLAILSSISGAAAAALPSLSMIIPPPIGIGILLGANIAGAVVNQLHKPNAPEPPTKETIEVANAN